MSLFFYRAWAGQETEQRGGVRSELTPENPLYYTRFGYAALLGITLLSGLLLNGIYLLGYLVCPRAMLEVPHVAMVSLAIRDLLVCLFVLPAALDWLIVGLTSWPGGQIWCQTAVFFDYYLNTLHPFLILTLCLILYTRKLPPVLPQDIPHIPQPIDTRLSSRSGYTRQSPYRRNDISQAASTVRAPSVTGSVQSSRHSGFRKGFSKGPSGVPRTPGSVNGSFRGGIPSVSGSATVSGSVMGRGRGRANFSPPFLANSTMSGVEEEFADPEEGELWELASMEYPGKADMMDLHVEEDESDPEEPRLREWMKYFVFLCWFLALGIGIPATLQAQYDDKIPNGCYIHEDPNQLARSRNSVIIQDASLNMLISSVVVTYIIPSVLMLVLSILLRTTRWTKDGKLNRFYKMAIALCILFISTKSPVDIYGFQELIHTSQLFSVVNRRPDELEREILFVWVALMPVVGNPIIYLFCVTEYRSNIRRAWRMCLGTEKNADDFLDLRENEDVGMTKETDMM